MNADQFRLLTPAHDGDTVTLACLICWEPFEDNTHALIHITDLNPRLDAVHAAVDAHEHGKGADL